MTKRTVYVNDLAFVAPGIETKEQLYTALQDGPFAGFPEDWKATPVSISKRLYRRFSQQTLLAISTAEKISPAVADNAAWVFGSAFGEGETLQVILEALRAPNMAIRPTRFQNSVHNAASGQWTIAQGIKNAATSICAGDCTAGASLLKAVLQAQLEQRDVGLVLFDAPLPYPLDRSHPVSVPVGVGLALSPHKGQQSIAALEIDLGDSAVSASCSPLVDAAQIIANPMFSVLPLVERLIGLREDDIVVDLNGGLALKLRVELL